MGRLSRIIRAIEILILNLQQRKITVLRIEQPQPLNRGLKFGQLRALIDIDAGIKHGDLKQLRIRKRVSPTTQERKLGLIR